MIKFEKLFCELDEDLNLNTQLQKIFGIGKNNNICKIYGLSIQSHSSVIKFISNSNLEIEKENDLEFDIEYYILTNRLTGEILRQTVTRNIQKKISMKTYVGHRHHIGLPVRGQRTHTNSKTRKKNLHTNLMYISGFKKHNLMGVKKRNALKKYLRRKDKEKLGKEKKKNLNAKKSKKKKK